MRLFLNSVPLSYKIYLGHMCTGRYLLMKVETIVSADLSSMGNASGHPVKWSMIVSICLFLDVLSFTLSNWIYCNFVKWSVGDLHHLKWIILNFGFSYVAQGTICNVFLNILVHAFPIIFVFNQTVGVGVSLMS